MMRNMKPLSGIGAAAILAALFSGAAAFAAKPVETFTGFGVHLVGHSRKATIEIGVDRWSTDAEQARFLDILRNHGQAALIDALQHAPAVGYIRTANSLGYELRYARSIEMPDGSRRVVVATDRPVRFREAATPTRSRYYNFAIAEMRFPAGQKGSGKFAPATSISIDPSAQTLVIENYGIEPVRMSSITDRKS
jgi:hypothetical protein